MRKGKLFILAALEMESRAVAKALGTSLLQNRNHERANPAVEVHTIGMRAERLPGVLPLLAPAPEDRFWMVGLGGALDPTLKVGDLVIDCESLHFGDQLADWTVRRGRIHTSDRLVASAAEKRALFVQTAALAVDMEQRIVRQTLAPLGFSVVGIRAISDTAETSLDATLTGLVDPIGRPKWPALAAALCRRPALLVSLLRLGRDSSLAVRALAQAIERLAGLELS